MEAPSETSGLWERLLTSFYPTRLSAQHAAHVCSIRGFQS